MDAQILNTTVIHNRILLPTCRSVVLGSYSVQTCLWWTFAPCRAATHTYTQTSSAIALSLSRSRASCFDWGQQQLISPRLLNDKVTYISSCLTRGILTQNMVVLINDKEETGPLFWASKWAWSLDFWSVFRMIYTLTTGIFRSFCASVHKGSKTPKSQSKKPLRTWSTYPSLM